MKMWKILPVAAALFLGTQTFAWAQETSGETTKTEKKESEVEQDLKRLREWVRQQSEKVATTTRAEWPSIKSDFARHADKIESGFQQLSEESKREYVELKAKFNDLESKPFYDEVPLQAEEVKRREKELLGQFSNIQSIKGPEMRAAYIMFQQNVRAKRQNWIPRDWDYADYVLQKLGKRKEAVESQLTTLDEIKIRSLIGEFNALRSGQEFREKQKAKSNK